MAIHTRSVIILLAIVVVAVVGCSGGPTPDIEATVEARVKEE